MKKTYLSLILLAVLFAACTENFDDFNIDKKNPAIVEGNALFTSAQLTLVDQISTPDVSLNIFRLWAQYWTQTTYTEEANYDIITGYIPDNTFSAYYKDVLTDFNEAARLIAEETTANQGEEIALQNRLHIIDLMMVYAYHQLVDIFGNVPYSESLDLEKVLPGYDDAFTIYEDLITRVNTALAGLDDSEGSFGSADIIYGGDVAAWIKFGNSLKVKLGIIISDHDAVLAQSTIESAVSGVFESIYDNALLYYLSSPPNSNPVYDEFIVAGNTNFVGANTMIDLMNGLDDPRRSAYFTMVDTSTEWGVGKLAYLGGTYGEPSPYEGYSHVAEPILEATFPGILLTYDEVLFYLAEAAERGFEVGRTAEEYYNDAIAASFEFWGISDVESYLAKPEVAYATAQGNWKEKVGTQAYIALYSRGLEGYTEWRRLDYPVFNIPPAITEYNDIPKRFTYPEIEQWLNLDNYTSASIAIGGDDLTTKIFWDKD
jgi:hypothetical protein